MTQRILESSVELAQTVSHDSGSDVVTVAVTSNQHVPVLVRFESPVPSGRAVVDREEAAVSDTATELRTHAFDRLECLLVVAPGETVRLRYALESERSADPAEPELELVAVVPITAETASAVDTAAFWWAGDTVYRLSTTGRFDDEVPSLDPADQTVRSDGGEIRLDPAVGKAEERTALPAVGVVARANHHEDIVLTVTRARVFGHDVFVTYESAAGEESARLAADLGATVVDPPSEGADREALRGALVSAARDGGYPGLLVQPESGSPIDYVRTERAFDESSYAVPAIPKAWSTTTDRPHVVAAIPAYNAAGTVGEVARQAAEYADVVVVVDDGSGDGTGDAAREAGATVIEHRRNRGYGGALKTAFKEADRLEAEYLVILDADGQHDPADIPRLVEAHRADDAEIVIGSRYVGERGTELPTVRRLGLGVINGLTNLSLGRVLPRRWVRDTQSGFRSYDRDAIASLAADPDIGDRMGASTDIIYHASRERYAISEVGTTIRYDVEHSSTLNPFVHGYDLVRNIVFTLTVVHPFKTLGVIGALMTTLGFGVALEGVALGIETGDVPFVKTYAALLVGVVGVLVAIVSLDYQRLRTHPYYRRH